MLPMCRYLLTLSLCGFAASASANPLEHCKTAYLIETKVVIGNKIVDPGGVAAKEAEKQCKLEQSKDRRAFDKKYAKKPA